MDLPNLDSLLVYLVLGGSIVIFSTSALLAFCWAAKTNQFQSAQKESEIIFNEEEPIGKQTDFFPRESREESQVP